MLIGKEGGYKKLVCQECGGDNVCKSGLGGNLVSCLKCMTHVPQDECLQVDVTDPNEIQLLQQVAD